ncbi:unnamed protein product, partial [Polarella glacialis]
VVSPATWTWERETLGKDLRTLLTERRLWSREVAVAGLPCINSSRVFNWPLRRVRYGYWKLAYEEYATGHETSPYLPLTQFWAVGRFLRDTCLQLPGLCPAAGSAREARG